ncbi:hypothetical protein TNCV_3584131 [Trichonephila clavipes]|nr:hypothetical protein TNCV_3584131 [Trichonephila clavipes]
MEVPLRTAYGQNGRCGMQPKAKHSLRAQAQLMRTETVETFELVKVEPKLLRERKENARGERYKDVFGCAPRIGLSTSPIQREVFDLVENEQQLENALTALTACSERKDGAGFAKEAFLNETVKVLFELYEDTPKIYTVKLCVVYSKNYEDSLF